MEGCSTALGLDGVVETLQEVEVVEDGAV